MINSWYFWCLFFWMFPPPHFNWHPQFSVKDLFQKKTKWRIKDILSWKLPLEFLIFNFLTPWNSTRKSSPLFFFFFWNSPMTGVKVVYILGSFCWYQICSSQVLHFQKYFYTIFLSCFWEIFLVRTPQNVVNFVWPMMTCKIMHQICYGFY